MVFIVSYAALYPWAEFSVSEGVIFLTGSFFDETMDTTKHLKLVRCRVWMDKTVVVESESSLGNSTHDSVRCNRESLLI